MKETINDITIHDIRERPSSETLSEVVKTTASQTHRLVNSLYQLTTETAVDVTFALVVDSVLSIVFGNTKAFAVVVKVVGDVLIAPRIDGTQLHPHKHPSRAFRLHPNT